MAKTHFEQVIEAEKRKTADASMKAKLGDSHEHARMCGYYQGLEKALELSREAARKDLDE